MIGTNKLFINIVQENNMSAKYCILEPNGQAIMLEITVEPNIVAGGDFKLINPETNQEIKNWKMSVDNDNPFKIRVHSDPEALHKVVMTWEILCCTMNVDVFESTIKMKLTQAMKTCKITEQLHYTRLNIPPCKLNEPDSFKDSIVFVIKR
jgi:hypothetical protein